MPEYLTIRKKRLLSFIANLVNIMIATLPTTLKIRNGIHCNSNRRGLSLILIDQTCECIATPMIIAALIKEMKM